MVFCPKTAVLFLKTSGVISNFAPPKFRKVKPPEIGKVKPPEIGKVNTELR